MNYRKYIEKQRSLLNRVLKVSQVVKIREWLELEHGNLCADKCMLFLEFYYGI